MRYNIQHDRNNQKFFISVNGFECLLMYEKEEYNVLNCKHTFIPEPLRGKGIGSEIVKEVIEYAIKNNYRIYPSCPFVESFMNRHREYDKLLVKEIKI